MSDTRGDDWRSVAGLLDLRAGERGGGLAAASSTGERLSWAGSLEVATAVAAAVQGHGARIGVWLPNRVDFGAALFGVWRAGATAAVLSALASPDEVARLVATAGIDVVVTDRVRGAGLHGCRTVVVDDLGAEPSGGAAPTARLPEEALVVFTSGTTGAPKGIAHSGLGLARSLQAMAASSGLDDHSPRALAPADRSPNLALTPVSHVSGLMALLFAWWAGKPMLLFDRFEPVALDRAVAEHGIRTLRLVPAMVYDLVNAPCEVTLAGVRYATVGTAALTPDLARRFEDRYGFPVLVTYGQSEAMGGIAAERLDDVLAGRRPSGSVGRALPGVDVRVVDLATGADVPSGAVGEIRVRSAQVMRGYVGPGDAGPPVDEHGYLRTGDLGSLDADGILSVVGRIRDVIVCGGFNVYPSEIEAVLAEHPDVQAVHVVGVPDERLGERPVAALVATDGRFDPAALDALVRARLAGYKRPRAYVGVDAMPQTAAGKPDRAALLALVAGRLAPGTATGAGAAPV